MCERYERHSESDDKESEDESEDLTEFAGAHGSVSRPIRDMSWLNNKVKSDKQATKKKNIKKSIK